MHVYRLVHHGGATVNENPVINFYDRLENVSQSLRKVRSEIDWAVSELYQIKTDVDRILRDSREKLEEVWQMDRKPGAL